MRKAGFEDRNNNHVTVGDKVHYVIDKRNGTLVEALQDGDAYVQFDNHNGIELVKWHNLVKVK